MTTNPPADVGPISDQRLRELTAEYDLPYRTHISASDWAAILARLQAAEARATKAEREADERLHEKNMAVNKLYRMADDADERRRCAEARAARAEEALRPFADAAVDLDETDKDDWHLWEHPAALDVKVADLRRAKAATDATCKETLQVQAALSPAPTEASRG